MKKLFTLMMMLCVLMISCTKEKNEPTHDSKLRDYLTKYDVQDAVVDEPAPYDVVTEVEKTGYWSREIVAYVLSSNLTPDEKYEYLLNNAGRSIEDSDIETIARKFSTTGNSSVNGSNAYWDCSPALLAETISQVGTTCNINAINNYLNSGSSATSITLSDVLRAANGVNNTSFDATIELVDLVWEYEVSGGNWIVGAVILFEGQEYLFSELTGDAGGLIYSPQDGGAYLFGPMPGGIVSLNVTGLYTPPLTE